MFVTKIIDLHDSEKEGGDKKMSTINTISICIRRYLYAYIGIYMHTSEWVHIVIIAYVCHPATCSMNG